jgi:hypothetical protein
MVGIRRTQGMPTSKRLRTPRAILESRLAHRGATAHNAPDRIATEPNMNSAPSSSPDSSADSGVSLINVLAGELERPRPLPAQVVKHLSGTHGVERENIGEFLVRELPALEDYEIDLALAPVFTPTLAEQAVFAELLGERSVPTSEWPGLVRTLTERPTTAHLVTDDGHGARRPAPRCFHRTLRASTAIERNDSPFPVHADSTNAVPGAKQPFVKAIARRATWELAVTRCRSWRAFVKQSEASAELVERRRVPTASSGGNLRACRHSGFARTHPALGAGAASRNQRRWQSKTLLQRTGPGTARRRTRPARSHRRFAPAAGVGFSGTPAHLAELVKHFQTHRFSFIACTIFSMSES